MQFLAGMREADFGVLCKTVCQGGGARLGGADAQKVWPVTKAAREDAREAMTDQSSGLSPDICRRTTVHLPGIVRRGQSRLVFSPMCLLTYQARRVFQTTVPARVAMAAPSMP